MILELFVVLLALSFFIILLGFNYGDNVYKTIGFFFVFLLSLVLINGALQLKTGNVINTVNASSTSISYVYSNYSDSSSHWIGYLLAIASSIGMIVSFMYPNGGSIKQ